MNRVLVTLAFGLVVGAAAGFFYAQQAIAPGSSSDRDVTGASKPLFYRNAMNPAVTSLVPAKDEMGMDYVPVYAEATSTPGVERKPLFYRNPMNPTVTSTTPAKDAMGMDYIPVYAEGGTPMGDKSGTVTIDAQTTQNIGVRTAVAVQQTLGRSIRAVGRVVYNEEGLRRLHPKTEGWIEKLFIDETGVAVRDGTILLALYSPQLVSSEQEYLLALKSQEIFADSKFEDIRDGANALIASARERLHLLDVPDHQITELEKTRVIKKSLHIHSPFAGIVVNIGAREGQYVTPQTELYMIADLSRVWVYADVYEDDLPWVRVGDSAAMTLSGIPGETFNGKVTYIYPYLESGSRTIRVRLEFDNPRLRLKPDMYTNVLIEAGKQFDAVVVPSEAIVRSGEREIVFIDRGAGKFEPRDVNIGVSADGLTQIVSGVQSGERVVASGQFLIDSESKLREATAKMLDTMKPSNRSDAGTALVKDDVAGSHDDQAMAPPTGSATTRHDATHDTGDAR